MRQPGCEKYLYMQRPALGPADPPSPKRVAEVLPVTRVRGDRAGK
jgi:hypothetical protein